MSKLLFTDIDGTLLKSDQTISKELKNALCEMSKQGHGMVLTSGRPLDSIMTIYKYLNISFPYSYIIANNGGLIYDCNSSAPLFEKRLDINLVDKTQHIADQMGVHLQTYRDDAIVCEKEDPEILSYTKHVKMPVQYSAQLSAALSKGPFKMLALNLDGSDALMEFRSIIDKEMGKEVHTMFSGSGYLEIIPYGVDKGVAVHTLCTALNIPAGNSIAVGDSENDIPMIQAAGIGFAMKNASDEVKSSADKITALDFDHDGILEIIHNYILGQDS